MGCSRARAPDEAARSCCAARRLLAESVVMLFAAREPGRHLAGLPHPGRIEDSFLQQLAQLPYDTRRGLLVAAAEPLGDPALLSHAIERLGIESAVLEPAESAGLLEIDARVRFRHPLLRSAVYRAATPPDRREAHRVLAESTDANVDADRRVWHFAEATAGPDDAVAGELERAAGRAQARGGVAAAAAFVERAAALTSRSP